MLDRITTAQIHCYLSNIKWELFHQFADEFMGVKVEQVQADLNTLQIQNTYSVLRARRLTLKPEGLPWDIDLSLSFFRKSVPYDSWLGVQFARDICLATGAQSYCDIPAEVGMPSIEYYWQLSFFQAPNNELVSEIVQLQELDDQHFIEVESKLVDLRNYELFQTPIPYK